LSDAEQLALATGAAAYRWEDLTKAPVSPSMLLNPRRYGDGAKDLLSRPKSRAIKGIDEDMKLNKALREMVEVLRNGAVQ
jgi:hypothetical protein